MNFTQENYPNGSYIYATVLRVFESKPDDARWYCVEWEGNLVRIDNVLYHSSRINVIYHATAYPGKINIVDNPVGSHLRVLIDPYGDHYERRATVLEYVGFDQIKLVFNKTVPDRVMVFPLNKILVLETIHKGEETKIVTFDRDVHIKGTRALVRCLKARDTLPFVTRIAMWGERLILDVPHKYVEGFNPDYVQVLEILSIPESKKEETIDE